MPAKFVNVVKLLLQLHAIYTDLAMAGKMIMVIALFVIDVCDAAGQENKCTARSVSDPPALAGVGLPLPPSPPCHP